MDFDDALRLLGRSFTLHPITEQSLFAGRTDKLRDLFFAMFQDGQHPIVYGERGVGKTSIANVAAQRNSRAPNGLSIKINCDGRDSFYSLWKKVFDRVNDEHDQPYSDRLDTDANPEDVRALFEEIAKVHRVLIVIDEFDKYPVAGAAQVADLIKTVHDHVTPVKLVFVGVADSVSQLVTQHQSIGRALAEIPMPRMQPAETAEIVRSGYARVPITADNDCVDEIVQLSQGLPYYAQLLGLNAGMNALADQRAHVEKRDVGEAIKAGVDKAAEPIKALHHAATSSPQQENLFRRVLLACALATPDERGYFAAADVRHPLSVIMGKAMEIPSFNRHLQEFTVDRRGPVLTRIGRPRSYRFRFTEPLLQPYVIMEGLATGLLSVEKLSSEFP